MEAEREIEAPERVGLREARGRVTAADLKAPVDLPPFDNSAVDGYAVHHADLKSDGDTSLTVAGRLTAGSRPDQTLKPGQAIRIFTGATCGNPSKTETSRNGNSAYRWSRKKTNTSSSSIFWTLPS